MSNPVIIVCAPSDTHFAQWIADQLHLNDYPASILAEDTSNLSDQHGDYITSTTTVLLIVSPNTIASDTIAVRVALARQHNATVLPLLAQYVDAFPWYVEPADVLDFSNDIERPLALLLARLPRSAPEMTFAKARDAYLNRATLKSTHTLAAYERSIDLFFAYLSDRYHDARGFLPIQSKARVTAAETPLHELSQPDAPVFLHFAQWLLSPASSNTSDKRPYKPSTVELRIAGVINWFQFMDDHGWLPPSFQLAKAKRIIRDELRGRPTHTGPAQPPDSIEEVIYFYDNQEYPPRLRKPDADTEQIRRWEITRLRNRALLHALAETGGRISEILSLNLADFPVRRSAKHEVLRVDVRGKGGHSYALRFFDSLDVIYAYIEARGARLRASAKGDVPLFVSHDPRFDGQRMSRIVAWRVVHRAARALGLKDITPHDFRHWRATQLLNAGHPIDVVQDYLGHRSIETTRTYYARTDPLRVDDAARNTGLPAPESPDE
jgi:integrase